MSAPASLTRSRMGPSRFLALAILLSATGLLVAYWMTTVRAAEPTLSLALVAGGVAAVAVAWANYRERIVIGRIVAALRDPERRDGAIAELRRKVDRAFQARDIGAIEDALRFAIEPLVITGFWDDVAAFASRATPDHVRPAFARWLAGVHALAELHRGELDEAEAALAAVEIEGSWLLAVDALRLAVQGDGEAALARLGPLPMKKMGLAARFQRDLAQVHAWVAVGRRDEARTLLEAALERKDQPFLDAVVRLEGPASPLARSVLAGTGAGPFRS